MPRIAGYKNGSEVRRHNKKTVIYESEDYPDSVMMFSRRIDVETAKKISESGNEGSLHQYREKIVESLIRFSKIGFEDMIVAYLHQVDDATKMRLLKTALNGAFDESQMMISAAYEWKGEEK